MFTLKVKDKHYRIPDLEKLRQLLEAGKVKESTQIYERDSKQWVTVGEVFAREAETEDEVETAAEADDFGYNESSEYAQTVMGGDDSFATPKASEDTDRFSFAPMGSDEPETGAQNDAYDPTTQFGSIDMGGADPTVEEQSAQDDQTAELDTPKSFAYGSDHSKPEPKPALETPVAPAGPQANIPVAAPPVTPPPAAKPPKAPAKKGALGAFFGFDVLISSALVKVIYAIGFILITLGLVAAIATAAMGMDFSGKGISPGITIVGAVFAFAVSQIIWRVLCEVWILAFSIHDHLVSVDNKLD